MTESGKPVYRKPVPEGVIEHIGVGVGSATAIVEVHDGLLMIAGRGCYPVRRLRADLGKSGCA